MSEANWPEAQKVLANRLQHASDLPNLRLNLFLLAVSAASSGHQDTANHLWAQAQQAPLDETVSRYLDLDLELTYNDPRQQMLLDLEKAWWSFNGWNKPQPLALVTEEEPTDSIDWVEVLECTLQGRSGELETKYRRAFEEVNAETSILWNFLALAYLQSGNVRNYEEMVSNSPPTPSPDSVPVDLALALENDGLHAALETLDKGHWLTNEVLFQGQSAETAIMETTDAVDEAEWLEQMENGFALVDLNQLLDACRVFQLMASRAEERDRQLLSLNALSLAFFKLGDYTQAETVYSEFQNILSQFPVDPGSELALRYQGWLESVSASQEGSIFFSPFGTKSDWTGGETLHSEVDFWTALGEVLNLLSGSDFNGAKRALQSIEGGLSEDQFNEKYLVCLGFLTSAVMAGDHFAVQEFEVEVDNLRHHVHLQGEELDIAVDTFRWAGFEIVAERLKGQGNGKPSSISPWQDLVKEETADDSFGSFQAEAEFPMAVD